jgi:hypothetical protein
MFNPRPAGITHMFPACLLLIFSMTFSSITSAQSADENRARAYFFAAEEAYDAERYVEALLSIEEALVARVAFIPLILCIHQTIISKSSS